MTISIRSVDKRFGRYPALNSVSLDIRDGELLALLGPSGSGKTTLLRVIAGLEFPDRGQVLFEDEDVTYLNAAARRVGFVFQQYALFKHMTVAKNVAFGLDVRKRRERPSRPEIAARVDELLGLVELGGLGRRFPSQLSGGQRQRVALARALAVSPRVLLLDEPFGALDATVRKSLRRELRRIHDATGVTTIFVTHDQEEALEVANRVVVMDKGKIEQIGTPEEVYDRPQTAFVHSFIGESIVLPVNVQAGRVQLGDQVLGIEPNGAAPGPSQLFIRRHDVQLEAPGNGDLEGAVRRVRAFGPIQRADVALRTNGGETMIEIDAPRDRELKVGEIIGLKPKRYRIFAAEA